MTKLHGKMFVSVVEVLGICQEQCTGIVLMNTTMNSRCCGRRQTQLSQGLKKQSAKRNQDSHSVRQSCMFAVEGAWSDGRLHLRFPDKRTTGQEDDCTSPGLHADWAFSWFDSAISSKRSMDIIFQAKNFSWPHDHSLV
jgi:hypothetical protein